MGRKSHLSSTFLSFQLNRPSFLVLSKILLLVTIFSFPHPLLWPYCLSFLPLNVLLTVNSSAHNSFCSFSAPLSSFFSFTLYLLHIVFLAFVLSPYCCCLHFILPKLIFYTYHVIWLVWLMAPCLGVYLSLCLFVGFHNSVYMRRLLASSWISLSVTHMMDF